jgi:hypothetical protein
LSGGDDVIDFLLPWGLVAFGALGVLAYLYLHVFRGRRRRVSGLFLWELDASLRREGRRRARPPWSLPMAAELLAAALLAALVAGLVFVRASDHPHLAVVLDSSASMTARSNGGSARDAAIARIRELAGRLGRGGRVSIVLSGTAELLGGRALAPDEISGPLRDWRPADPPHNPRSTIELARSLVRGDQPVVLVTDRPADAAGAVVIGVGRPLANAGWVAARWLGDDRLFALARYAGPSDRPAPSLLATVYAADAARPDAAIGRIELDFAERRAVPITLDIPSDADAIRIELPDDPLAADNVLRMARPRRIPVAVRLDLADARLRAHLDRALDATGRTTRTDAAEADLAFVDKPGAPPGGVTVAVHSPPAGRGQLVIGPYLVDPLAADDGLLDGVDLADVSWRADPDWRPPRGADTLVAAGPVPIIARRRDLLLLNLAAQDAALFDRSAWPVLIANVVAWAERRSRGLHRFAFRVGDALPVVRRPAAWRVPLAVRSPDGAVVPFDGDVIRYGRLRRSGFYAILAGGEPVATFSANLLSAEESDLTAAATFGDPREVRAALVPDRSMRRVHRELFAAAVAALLVCWVLLERRGRGR